MYTNYLISEDYYLAHYGVKGMKWGVRHDRNKNTNTVRNTKSNELKVFKLDRTAKIALAIGGISLGVALGTAAYRTGRLNADSIIKAGTLVQNIAPRSREFDNSFYGVYDKKSQRHFLKEFSVKPNQRWYNKEGRDKATIFKSDKDIRIAGFKQMKKALEQYEGKKVSKKEFDEFFRGYGALPEGNRNGLNYILANMGYGGFKDYNDITIGWGDTPTVFFGAGERAYIDSGLRKAKEVLVNVDKAHNLKTPAMFKYAKEESAIQLGKTVAIFAGLYGVNRGLDNAYKENVNPMARSEFGKDYNDLTKRQKKVVDEKYKKSERS